MAAVLLACLVACLATKSLNKALSLHKALLILPFMAEPALSLNKAVLSLALLAEPGYSALRWWRVREFGPEVVPKPSRQVVHPHA